MKVTRIIYTAWKWQQTSMSCSTAIISGHDVQTFGVSERSWERRRKDPKKENNYTFGKKLWRKTPNCPRFVRRASLSEQSHLKKNLSWKSLHLQFKQDKGGLNSWMIKNQPVDHTTLNLCGDFMRAAPSFWEIDLNREEIGILPNEKWPILTEDIGRIKSYAGHSNSEMDSNNCNN